MQLRGAFEGGGSWITQMWDQIFMMFHDCFSKLIDACVTSHNAQRTNDRDVFVMQKRHVLLAMSTMHRGGHCGWCSPGDLAMAFAKVGIGLDGVSLTPLLANPAITNAPTAAPRDTRCAAASTVPVTAPHLPRVVGDWCTPEKVRKGTTEHWKLKCEHSQQEAAQCKRHPQDVLKLQADIDRPTPYQQQVVSVVASELKCLDRKNQKTVKPPGANAGNVTGLINRMQWFVRTRDAQVQSREATAKAGQTKKDADIALRNKWQACKNSADCTCGDGGCAVQMYNYCRGCDEEGRKCMQKAVCFKQKCRVGAQNKAALLAPAVGTVMVPGAPAQGAPGIEEVDRQVEVSVDDVGNVEHTP